MRMGPCLKLQMAMYLLSISYIKDLNINCAVWGTNKIIFHDLTVQEELVPSPIHHLSRCDTSCLLIYNTASVTITADIYLST